MTRHAQCRCGQLTAVIEGDPVRVSICHCDACKLRTGGAFSAQARFPNDAVAIAGVWKVWERVADSGSKAWHRWCPHCGATIAYENETAPGSIAIPLGAIVKGGIPDPGFSIHEDRKMPWAEITGHGVVHD